MLKELQNKINSIYPSNHCFDITTLQGTNNESINRINYLAPYIKQFVVNNTVFDIGANKGWFSFFALEMGARKVILQEPITEYIELAKAVAKLRNINTITFIESDIKDFFIEGDIALVLGVAHYLTFENGLDWILELYQRGYDLLLEFPYWEEDPVVKTYIDKVDNNKLKLLNENNLFEIMDGIYDIEFLAKSPDLNRKIIFL